MRNDLLSGSVFRVSARLRILFFAILLLLSISPIMASAETANSDSELKIIEKESSPEIALNRTIRIAVGNLDTWMQKGFDMSKFVLVIDGNELKGLEPSIIDGNSNHPANLQYDLKRSKDSDKIWDSILSRRTRGFALQRPVSVSVRYANAAVNGAYTAQLLILNKFWFSIFVVLFATALGIFIYLARKSDVLRVPGDQPDGVDRYERPNRKCYSLARTQMAFWFFTIIISYVFIWMVTDDLACLTTSVVSLMGISAVTGLGSAAVDASKKGVQDNLRATLEEKNKSNESQADALQIQLEEMKKIDPDKITPEIGAKMIELNSGIASIKKDIDMTLLKIKQIDNDSKPKASKDFLVDILSDDDGISFHRFQMFTWTIVLIIIFATSVYRVLAMPEFDTTLLALMGISSGTYIGFKLPAQQG